MPRTEDGRMDMQLLPWLNYKRTIKLKRIIYYIKSYLYQIPCCVNENLATLKAL